MHSLLGITPSYSYEDQETFIGLPESKQKELVDVAYDVAEILDAYIVKLDETNYGAPPKESGITIHMIGDLSTEKNYPSAICNSKWDYFYNTAGLKQLAKVLWRTIPNYDQFAATINTNPDLFRQNLGCYCDQSGRFIAEGEISAFWHLPDEHNIKHINVIMLDIDSPYASRGAAPDSYFFPVRFIKEN